MNKVDSISKEGEELLWEAPTAAVSSCPICSEHIAVFQLPTNKTGISANSLEKEKGIFFILQIVSFFVVTSA